MKYVGLDISTKTGIAIINPDHPKGVTVSTKQVTSTKTGMDRAHDIWNQVSILMNEAMPDHYAFSTSFKIIIEGYGFVRTQNLVPLIEIGTVMRYNLWTDGYKYIDVPPTSLKKFVTGKGNVKKEQMLKEVFKRFHIDCYSSDEADAVGLAYFGMALDNKLKIELPKAHLEALKKFQ